MDFNGIVAQPEWRKRECLFCHKELGWLERLKQRTKKSTYVKNAGGKSMKNLLFGRIMR